MTEPRRSRTRTLPPNDQKVTDQPATASQDTTDQVEVVGGVTHFHGGERDFHRHGGSAHHHIDGRLVDGAWAPDGVKLWVYVGIADVNEHRHDDRFAHSHDPFGQQEHFHNPRNNAVLPLPADGWPVEYQPHQTGAEEPAPVVVGIDPGNPTGIAAVTPEGTYTAGAVGDGAANDAVVVQAADGGLPNPAELTPEQREQLKAYNRRSLTNLDGSAPTPEPLPARTAPSGASLPGTSIAEVGAEDLRRSILFEDIQDPALQHEMTWHGILLRAVVEMATYHADNRRKGGTAPECAPDDLIAAIGDAYEQIRLPRRAAIDATREAQP